MNIIITEVSLYLNSQNLIKEIMKKFHFHFIIKEVTYVVFEGNKWSRSLEDPECPTLMLELQLLR